MSLRANSISFRPPKKTNVAATIIARQDRIPVWALPTLFIGVIGTGFFFTYFDIVTINVSFIQTCMQIIPSCLPQTANKYIGAPVLLNLLGYVLGSLVLSPLADRYGRKDMLVVTLVITGLGSLYSVFVSDYLNFILARTLTGVGIGADLALVNTYINELAPSQGRAKYTSLIFIMSMLGASIGIWTGLFLTTTPAPFPLGLPFAVAGPHFEMGWRVMYGIGAVLAVVGLLLRFQMPESPRWLISQGRLSQAELVVASMERQALTHLEELPPIAPELAVYMRAHSTGYQEILGTSLYLQRTILLLVMWLVGYITVYATAAGLTVLLATLGYPASEAGLLAAIGSLGGVIAALIAYALGERLERKYWILISAVVGLVGGITIALGGSNFAITSLGSILLFIGTDLWLPIAYCWSTENYPTRARASGFALVDGVGHAGGGIGVSFVASLTLKLGPLLTFVLIGGFLLVAACLALFGPATRQKRLDEISP